MLDILVEKDLNYPLMPSLEDIALVRIAVMLWDDDVGYSTSKFRDVTCTKREEETDSVIKKVFKLALPKVLESKLLNLIEIVGGQMFTWIDFHDPNPCLLVSNLQNLLCWTSQGRIDKMNTAKMLVQNESLNIVFRYKIACIYCLEDYIYTLWPQLDDISKEDLRMTLVNTHLISFWCFYVEGDLVRLRNYLFWLSDNSSPCEYAFHYSAGSGNLAATRYFWKKITSEKKGRILLKAAVHLLKMRFCLTCEPQSKNCCWLHYSEVLRFLISNMDDIRRSLLCRSCSYEVLKCLLDWPTQNYFVGAAKCIGDFLSKRYFIRLLNVIVRKVSYGFNDYDYQKLFGEFWQQSPVSYKRYAIGRFISFDHHLLSQLFEVEDKKNIALILKDATLEEKETIILHSCGQNICRSLVQYDKKWDLVKFFVQQCISSKEVMIKFKEQFICYLFIEDSEKDTMFQLLDDLLGKDDKKRSIEEGKTSDSKRFYSMK